MLEVFLHHCPELSEDSNSKTSVIFDEHFQLNNSLWLLVLGILHIPHISFWNSWNIHRFTSVLRVGCKDAYILWDKVISCEDSKILDRWFRHFCNNVIRDFLLLELSHHMFFFKITLTFEHFWLHIDVDSFDVAEHITNLLDELFVKLISEIAMLNDSGDVTLWNLSNLTCKLDAPRHGVPSFWVSKVDLTDGIDFIRDPLFTIMVS